MAAVFPLDTTKPWTFNGVTYEYDAADDRWFVISTNKTDFVDESLETFSQDIDIINTVIDQEIDNRTALLNQAASKNNEQDTRLNEIDARLELIANNIGVLDFAGLFQYMPLVTEETCNAEFSECVLAAGGDPAALQACTQEQARCIANITTELPSGKFTSDSHVYADVNYLRISNETINDATYDWVSLIEPGDYIELVEQNLRDTVLYEVLTDARSDSENIRVQFVRQTNLGDSEFNDDETYAIRVFKEEQGLDLNAGDARYVQRPYTVMFSDDPPELGEAFTGVLKNGELWYDTQNLELFVWNNNAWVTAAKPPSQDVVIQDVIGQVDALTEQQFNTSQELNSLVSDLILENNIYYSDETPSGDITGTLRNGDIWIDSDDLTIKFYSGGAWINPDRQVGGDYLEKSGGELTGDLEVMGGPELGGANIYLWNNGFTRYGWGNTPTELYGGYVFMRDENNFEIGTYDNKDLKLKAGSIFIDGQLEILNTDNTNHEGFTIYGTTKDGVPGKLLQAYHNSGNLPDAVNYTGVISSNTNIVNKQYVDDRIAELETRIAALGG